MKTQSTISTDRAGHPGTDGVRGGDVHTMRKLFALAMVALLALSLAIAAVSCGKKAEETPAEPTAEA